jgi:hypothetical protein
MSPDPVSPEVPTPRANFISAENSDKFNGGYQAFWD